VLAGILSDRRARNREYTIH